MDSMWLEIVLNARSEELDLISATLIANGVPGLAVEEEEEFRFVIQFPLRHLRKEGRIP